jgi:hypothetical protein
MPPLAPSVMRPVNSSVIKTLPSEIGLTGECVTGRRDGA